MKGIAIATFMSVVVVPGFARADSSLTVSLSAHVDTFCHIYPPQNETISVVNGRAQIGSVREICNTQDGYQVSTAFTNLSAGQLDVGDAAYVIDSQGVAVRNSDQPAVRVLNWRLERARLASATMPVVMQVTISPR